MEVKKTSHRNLMILSAWRHASASGAAIAPVGQSIPWCVFMWVSWTAGLLVRLMLPICMQRHSHVPQRPFFRSSPSGKWILCKEDMFLCSNVRCNFCPSTGRQRYAELPSFLAQQLKSLWAAFKEPRIFLPAIFAFVYMVRKPDAGLAIAGNGPLAVTQFCFLFLFLACSVAVVQLTNTQWIGAFPSYPIKNA